MSKHVAYRIGMITIAIGGVLAGHAIAFAAPAAHEHADGTAHLHDAVHAYLPTLAIAVLPLALLALAIMAIEEARTGRPRIDLPALLVLQGSLFAAQESIERLIVGGSPLEVFIDPVLWIGLAAQVFVGGVILLLVRGLARVANGPLWPHVDISRIAPLTASGLTILAAAPSFCAGLAPISRRGPPGFS